MSPNSMEVGRRGQNSAAVKEVLPECARSCGGSVPSATLPGPLKESVRKLHGRVF